MHPVTSTSSTKHGSYTVKWYFQPFLTYFTSVNTTVSCRASVDGITQIEKDCSRFLPWQPRSLGQHLATLSGDYIVTTLWKLKPHTLHHKLNYLLAFVWDPLHPSDKCSPTHRPEFANTPSPAVEWGIVRVQHVKKAKVWILKQRRPWK